MPSFRNEIFVQKIEFNVPPSVGDFFSSYLSYILPTVLAILKSSLFSHFFPFIT